MGKKQETKENLKNKDTLKKSALFYAHAYMGLFAHP